MSLGLGLVGAVAGALAPALWVYLPLKTWKMFGLDVKKELNIEKMVDQRMDGFMERIKKEIPMAGAFLSGSMGENLKNQAREEFSKMIDENEPPIKKMSGLIYLPLMGAVVGLTFGILMGLFI